VTYLKAMLGVNTRRQFSAAAVCNGAVTDVLRICLHWWVF